MTSAIIRVAGIVEEGPHGPLLLLRRPGHWHGPRAVSDLLDVGFTIYGVATMTLVTLFALTGMSARTFMRLFSVLLIVAGWMLMTDRWLAIRTGIDRIGRSLTTCWSARASGIGKIAAGCLAFALMTLGLVT